jgi:branched-chain amino acid transport system substrate-binding protein
VADEAYRDSDVDFRSQLTNIKNINPNLLFIPGMGKDMALIIKQARELGLSGDSIDIVGGDGFNDFMAEIAGEALEGTYFVNHLYPEDPVIQPALEQYRQVYKKEPMEWGNVVMMKDLTYWLVDAIKRAGVLDGEAIAKQLGETKDLKLDHVTLTISPDDHNPVNKPGVILRVGDDLRSHFFAKVEPK